MEEIFETTDSFQFDKLILSKPTPVAGGNYFIRCSINNTFLYIQPPKCKTKQGIMKAGKRFYTDLMFTNENEQFIRWMENLENHCQQFIFKNREKWFEGDMDLHDVENYFTSPLKLYKSGKFYISRTNVPSVLGKPTLKIYDETETEVGTDAITDKTDIMTIVEIQGIKCSARSFQIEIELKQMMILKPSNLFEKCIIKSVIPPPSHVEEEEEVCVPDFTESLEDSDLAITEEAVPDIVEVADKSDSPAEPTHISEEDEPTIEINTEVDINADDILEPAIVVDNDMEEVVFHLDELVQDDSIKLKKRNDVYYEMYREARKKAKTARDLALSTYLDAKRIKNTYMLEGFEDSDNSDLEDLMENDNDSLENE